MADSADVSDEKIFAAINLGRLKAERDYINSKLRAIVVIIDKEQFSVCHWCESPIALGHLFCERDPLDDGMCCSEMYTHEEKRRKDSGL